MGVGGKLKMTDFDLKVLEARNNPSDLIICQEDIDEQTEHFLGLLLSKKEDLGNIEVFMTDNYQNLNTTQENLKDFELLKEEK